MQLVKLACFMEQNLKSSSNKHGRIMISLTNNLPFSASTPASVEVRRPFTLTERTERNDQIPPAFPTYHEHSAQSAAEKSARNNALKQLNDLMKQDPNVYDTLKDVNNAAQKTPGDASTKLNAAIAKSGPLKVFLTGLNISLHATVILSVIASIVYAGPTADTSDRFE